MYISDYVVGGKSSRYLQLLVDFLMLISTDNAMNSLYMVTPSPTLPTPPPPHTHGSHLPMVSIVSVPIRS